MRYVVMGALFLAVLAGVGYTFSRGDYASLNIAQVLSVFVDNPDVPALPPPPPPPPPPPGTGGGSSGGGGGGGASTLAYAPAPVVSKAALCTKKGDLNGDGKVDIKDFSILAYWYKRTLTPAALAQCVDLNGDGKVSLADFSILAYYWGK